jgi:hypothetical protein
MLYPNRAVPMTTTIKDQIASTLPVPPSSSAATKLVT